MSPASIIFPATLADVPALTVLINRAYRGRGSRQGWTTEADLLDGPRINEAALRIMLRAPTSLLLKALNGSSNLAGCVYLEQVGSRLSLSTLAVAPESQARGVGRQLLAAAEAYARRLDCHTLKITVLSARPELLAWYERHGYRRTGASEPFPESTGFGRPRQPLTLLALEKPVPAA